jgi:Asp-tRNA(Asn)/Glu-tRNA(Gln) amidotransferase A subunit family amidase
MNAVFGFKPSFGRIPIADSYLGRCAGPITRTVADAALAMQVLSLPDARDFTALPPSGIDWTQLGLDVRGLRVGVCLEPLAGKTTDPEIVDAVERAAALFASAGASVTATGPYLSADLIGTTLVRFLTAHLWAQMNDDRFVDDLASATPEFVQAVSASGSLSALDLMRAYDGIPQLVAETMTMLDAFDVVLSPTSSVLAGPAESCMLTEVAAAANFTSAFNATGTPAASINCGFSQDGRPIGLQVAAGRNLDLRVLQVAAWYEANRPAEACPDWPALDLATPNTARQAPTE